MHNVENDNAQAKPSHKKAKVRTDKETYLWYLRLGHINQNRIERLVKDDPLNSLESHHYQFTNHVFRVK